MSTQYTPGPWQYAFEGGTVAFIVESDGTTVAKLSTTENSTAHSALPANARLIAAAPELLAALTAMVSYGAALGWDEMDPAHDTRPGAMIEARAALAKAGAL